MKGAYLGPSFSADEIENHLQKFGAVFHKMEDEHTLLEIITDKLTKGYIIGWHQGRMEFGPRALGNRSIIGDARSPEMQQKMNLKIKFRESFRPFAPSVMAEHASEYFDIQTESPYMLLVAPVNQKKQAS